GDNCAACHGRDGKGGRDFPYLTDNDWLWGGGPENIVQTMTVGVNTTHSQSRVSQMPAFGTDEMLDRKQVSDVAAYVYSLSNT
ncbi:c-type cytochrome, partial [Rhizobium ruizarguesonis]